MSIRFGRFHVTFKDGEQPHYLKVAWPAGAPSNDITRDRADARHKAGLIGMIHIESERRELNGIVHELQLYGKPDAFVAKYVGLRVENNEPEH